MFHVWKQKNFIVSYCKLRHVAICKENILFASKQAKTVFGIVDDFRQNFKLYTFNKKIIWLFQNKYLPLKVKSEHKKILVSIIARNVTTFRSKNKLYTLIGVLHLIIKR